MYPLTNVAIAMFPFGTSSDITQRTDILLLKSNLVVQYHDPVPLEDEQKGRKSWVRAHLWVGIIVCILNELQHKVGVPRVELTGQTC